MRRIKQYFQSIWLLTKCYFYLLERLARGYKWNMFTVDMETEEGRKRFTYKKTVGGYTFAGFKIRDRESEPYEKTGKEAG